MATSWQRAPGLEPTRAARSPWVGVKPGISFMGPGPCLEAASALSRGGYRVVLVQPVQPLLSAMGMRHDGGVPRSQDGRDLIAAVLDTGLTVIVAGQASGPARLGAGFSVRAMARALGLAIASKCHYHVALVMGPSGIATQDLVHEIEAASGKTMGPDFGLCLASTAPDGKEPGELIWASDRRAAATASAVVDALARKAVVTAPAG